MNLNVAPYDAGPTANLAFHRFVNGLVHSTIENNVLRLSDDEAYFFGNVVPNFTHRNQMFIRPVYAPLSALIDQGFEDNRPVMITGTPGVGKTTMRNWYVKHLIDRPFDPLEQVRTIFLHSSDTGKFFMIKMERTPVDPAIIQEGALIEVVVTASVGKNILEDLETLAPTGMTYSLVDIEDGGACCHVVEPLRPLTDRLVLFTSPSNVPSKRFRKIGLRRYYMPLWTLTELRDANLAMGLGFTDEIIHERYTLIGGMARFVFQQQLDFNVYIGETLNEKAAKLSLDTTSALVTDMFLASGENFDHSLAYFFVLFTGPGVADYEFDELQINWGTKFIVTEVIGRVCDYMLSQRMRNANHLFIDSVANPSIVGYLFEGWTIRQLHVAGLANMKWAVGGRSSSQFMTHFNHGASFMHEFPIVYADTESMAERMRAAATGTLIVPTSFEYPVIDCVMKGGTVDAPLYACIRVTVAHTQAISEASEASFVALMDAVFCNIPEHDRGAHIRNRTAIFYLVPPLLYESFRIPKVNKYTGRLLKLTLI